MSDFADRAAETAEQLDALHLQERRPEGPPATGRCLWCEAPLAPFAPPHHAVPRRWCDADCRDAWEHWRG